VSFTACKQHNYHLTIDKLKSQPGPAERLFLGQLVKLTECKQYITFEGNKKKHKYFDQTRATVCFFINLFSNYN